MIKDPPLLTIRPEFPRPTPAQLTALGTIPTGYAVDAMEGRGALDYRIKPLEPMSKPLIGVAMTCQCGPADNLALFGALAANAYRLARTMMRSLQPRSPVIC